jgi:hypothetical protein
MFSFLEISCGLVDGSGKMHARQADADCREPGLTSQSGSQDYVVGGGGATGESAAQSEMVIDNGHSFAEPCATITFHSSFSLAVCLL